MINYHFDKEERIPSPALVYYKDHIIENTKKAIAIAGDAARMWPHVKTHKMAELIEMQVGMGIKRFKCATVSEIRMTAKAGAEHIIWAYPIVGPNVELFLKLMDEFPKCNLYALADDMAAFEKFNSAAEKAGKVAKVLLDVNMGMNRTGMPIESIEAFYEAAKNMKGLKLFGLHCYDGHIHESDLAERKSHAEVSSEKVMAVKAKLEAKGYELPIMVMGGTPTFPCHAESEGVFLSPGTIFVSDHGYCKNYPDMAVVPAAAVLTRVLSHPGEGLFTLDTGTKAISADANPRGVIAELEGKCEAVMSSEEHWVFKMKPEFMELLPEVGTLLHAIPTHICPTTAMYDGVYVVSEGKLRDIWKVAGRERIAATALEELL